MYVIAFMLSAAGELKELFNSVVATRSLTSYFKSAWNVVDLVSICISFVSIVIWIYTAWYASHVFEIKLQYDVYTMMPNMWGRLNYNLEELSAMGKAFNQLRTIASLQARPYLRFRA